MHVVAHVVTMGSVIQILKRLVICVCSQGYTGQTCEECTADLP